jgi:hypothetical protein
MKMVKSLILGSAAGLIAMSGAQAADLPVKAKAVEYVRICSLYGAGFWYIPGTDTCMKIGGYLRVETSFNTNAVYGGAYNGVAGANNRLSNNFTTRARQDLTLDTRTATEYGVLRTFMDVTLTWTSGSYGGLATGGTAYTGDAIAGGSLGVYHAFIQFAGFTMGKTISIFDAPWANYPGNNFDGLVGGSGDVTASNQLTYTSQFGNGVSASISLQEPAVYYTTNIYNVDGFVPSAVTAPPTTFAGLAGAAAASGVWGVNSIGGATAPDIVGQLRVDQAWGLFQLSAAAHNNHAAYYGRFETTGHPDDKWGWAVQAALSIKNIPTGAGDTINMQAVYTDGASRYNFQSLVPTNFAIYGGTNAPGAYQSVGIAGVADTVYGIGTEQESVKTWGFRGAYTHNWDPYWNSAIYGAYAQLRYGDAGAALVCSNVLFVLAGTCNPDFNIAQLGLITRWTPVKGLTFSADLNWTHLDQKHEGFFTLPAQSAIAKPAAVYEAKDQDTIALSVRAQRNF